MNNDSNCRSMRVLKRGSRGYENVQFDKITERIRNLCKDLSPVVDPIKIAKNVISGIFDGITTEELDRISSGFAEEFKLIHPDYSTLASRILVSNMHKNTPDKFSECMNMHSNILSEKALEFINANSAELDAAIDHKRDYLLEYFGLRTLETSYLLKKYVHLEVGGKLQYKDYAGNVVTDVEFRGKGAVKNGVRVIPVMASVLCDRPQYMFMRVAIGILQSLGIEEVIKCYDVMSNLYFTHATPTLFNACGKKHQLNSCFLVGVDDTIDDIMDTLKDVSLISKWAGGIAVWYHNIRGTGSIINSTGGESSGPIPQLKMFDNASVCWDQGGKRKGSFAIYYSLTNIDAPELLELKLSQTTSENNRARNLFYGIWLEDYIQQRLEDGKDISLFSSSEAPGLNDIYDGMEVCSHCSYCHNFNYAKYIREPCAGYEQCEHKFVRVNAFTELYERYENDGLASRIISAEEVEKRIAASVRESGTPYTLSKDQANRLSNQSNVDTIRSSNLCVAPETYILTDKGQFRIADLAGQKVNIWNGVEFSEVTPVKTGKNQKLITINLSNGVSIDCTKYHKFYIVQDDKIICVEARNLEFNDKLIEYKLPTRELAAEKSTDIQEFLRDYSIMFPSAKKDYLLQIRLNLQTLGVDSNIIKDGLFYKLYISGANLVRYANLGFDLNKLEKLIYDDSIRVISIVDSGRISDTYCFNEPKRNMGMFNGILAGNCTEILEVSTPDSYACCTLASINLKRFMVKRPDGSYAFDFDKLYEVSRMITRNLDMVIDVNDYPVKKCEDNSYTLRPIGQGIQGLADVFCMMRIPFISPEASTLRQNIHETIYAAFIDESSDRAVEFGPHKYWETSPAASGRLHPDLWSDVMGQRPVYTDRYEWNAKKAKVMKTGLRNSLGIAHMPTVQTSQILGNNECFEPFNSNIYTKSTLAGKFTIVNLHMIRHLIELGLWSEELGRTVLANSGSLKNIRGIPDNVKEIYKTVWEIRQSEYITELAKVQPWVDQSISANIHTISTKPETLKKLRHHAWKAGMKTLNYYVNSTQAAKPMQNIVKKEEEEGQVCRMEEGCVMCSS